MKRLIGALVMVGVLVAPAVSEARQLKPQDRRDAVRFAKRYWADRGFYAADQGCYRGVRTKVGFSHPVYGRRGWLGYWDPPDPCRIVLNGNYGWSHADRLDPWWDLCSTVIHEYGHLVGWRSRTGETHELRNPNSIMAETDEMSRRSWWYPYFPACRYDGDDEDGDDRPDFRHR